MEPNQILVTIRNNLGSKYSAFEALCKNKDFESVKEIVKAQNGMNNLEDYDIRFIMGEAIAQESGSLADQVKLLTEDVKILKKDESQTKTNEENKGQFHTPRPDQGNEIKRPKSDKDLSLETLDNSDTTDRTSVNSVTALMGNEVVGGGGKKANRVKSSTAYKCDSEPRCSWFKWPVYSCVLAIAAIVGVDNSLNEVFISCNDVWTKCIGIFGWFFGVFMILLGVWSDDEWNKLVSVFGFVSCLIGSIFFKLSGKGVTVDGIVKFGSSVNQRLGKKVCPFQVLFATCIGYTCIWFLLYFEHLCTTDDKGVCVSDKTRVLFYIDICVLVLFLLFYPFLAYGLLGFKFFSMYSSGPDNMQH